MNLRSFVSMMDYAVGEIIGSCYVSSWFDGETKYVKKMRMGVCLYSKKKNVYDVGYKKPRCDRRITSMRIFTHTKK